MIIIAVTHLFFLFTIAVSVERWCRLRGNLLFYFKSRDHWSEPAGVIGMRNYISICLKEVGRVSS